jgi:hypothetical protein
MAAAGFAVVACPDLSDNALALALPTNAAIAANGNPIAGAVLARAHQRQQMVIAAECFRATPLEVASTNVYVRALEREAVRRNGGKRTKECKS